MIDDQRIFDSIRNLDPEPQTEGWEDVEKITEGIAREDESMIVRLVDRHRMAERRITQGMEAWRSDAKWWQRIAMIEASFLVGGFIAVVVFIAGRMR